MIIQIQPWIDGNELTELERVIKSTFVVEHDLTKEFEQMTIDMAGAKHAIAMANGTMALFCALKSLDIGVGDEVIVPNITFIATANAVILAGAKPVLCEIEKDTFCIDAIRAEKLITKKTKAIIPVHLYGQSADMDKILSLSKQYNIKVIEDAAQGVGVKFKGKHVGTFGEAGILSYYGNKIITCGEGGIVLTDNEEIAKKCYRLKNHGRDKKGVFIHEYIGFNFSFTEMQAAIGIAQMKKLEKIIQKKQTIYNKYFSNLKGLERFKPVYVDNRSSPVFWFTSFLSEDADELTEYLLKNGIQTRRFFYPLHLQPCYLNYDNIGNVNDDFSISEAVYNRGISLPSSFSLTSEEQDYVIEHIKKFYENRN